MSHSVQTTDRRLSLAFACACGMVGLTAPSVLSAQTAASSVRIERLGNGPIISPALHPSVGVNIQGPSVIRVPDWVEDRLGEYYLYFADHKGTYIRLAYADDLLGPWQIHPGGSLQIAESYFPAQPPEVDPAEEARLRALPSNIGHDRFVEATTPHIASPDVHVDEANRRIVMYYHGLAGVSRQHSRVATSSDGIHFDARPEPLGRTYMRAFEHEGYTYIMSMPGQFYRSRDPLSGFEEGPRLFNPNMRHSALLKRGTTLFVFWTQVGDVPEHIMVSTIDISGDWTEWSETPGVEVLRPELNWEGADAPLVPSFRSTAYGQVNQLRDPAIYEDSASGRTFLLYAVAGEAGIALAEVHFDPLVGETPTDVRAVDGSYISWREHIIDEATADFALSGSDGLVMADIDGDGYEDIVSVHESDSEYDSALSDPTFVPDAEGHVRIAFGSADPDRWVNITLAEGADAPAPEDAAIADVNGDGYLDVMVAAELAHLIYLQNPGPGARTTPWPRLILPMTSGRGSYIRVFLADLDGDGRPEATAPNKGAQRPGPADFARSTAVSVYKVVGDPLDGGSWIETELGHYSVPQNAEPVDLDGDGDLDIVVGTRGENRLLFFENPGDGTLEFHEHAIGINGARAAGFNLEYADLNDDGRLDIIGAGTGGLVWLEQPERIDDAWNAHFVGTFNSDSMTGLELADIDGDGRIDIMAGSYSRGPRENDGDVGRNDPLGRIGWFRQPDDATRPWPRHDVSRRKRGMFDKFIARDVDGDGDIDFLGTRGNSAPYDGVYWLEQVRSPTMRPAFEAARENESPEMPLPRATR